MIKCPNCGKEIKKARKHGLTGHSKSKPMYVNAAQKSENTQDGRHSFTLKPER